MSFHQQLNYRFLRIVVSVVLISQLLGCGGGDNSSGGSAGGNLTADAIVDVDINGSVGDGPIVGATVEIYNHNGKLLGSVMSDVAASYAFNIKTKGHDYPLLLKVSGGTDLVTGNVPDFELLSVAMSPSERSVNINPFSTLVVKMAQSMSGGVDAANVSASKAIVTGSFAFGLDPSVVSDPVTSAISESNVANIVKASEALGEMVRRTRDVLLTTGTVVSGDAVMAAIAADLTDGVLNGAGARGVNPAISASAKVVTSQVLVEALSNSLRVGGVIATEVIDQAIAITRPMVTSSQMTGSVRITSDMLKQAQTALSAAQVLDSGAAVQEIVNSVADITPNASPVEVATVLPADAWKGLEQAVTRAPYASTEEITAINQDVVYAGSGGTTTSGTTTGGTTTDGTTTGGTTTGGTTTGGTTTGGTTPDGTTTGGTTTDGTMTGGTTTGGTTPDGTTTESVQYFSDWIPMVTPLNGWGPMETDQSNGERLAGDGGPLTIGGQVYTKGLGVHAHSEVVYDLGGYCTAFTGQVGVDDEAGSLGSVTFEVWDGTATKLFDSGLRRGTDGPLLVSVDVTGVYQLRLVVTDGGDGGDSDHADWADARISCGASPPTADAGPDQVVIQGTDVQLNGSGTDRNGDTLSYQWTQTAGTPVTLSSNFVANPTFTAPSGLAADEVLTFELITRDAEFSSTAYTVNITVQAEKTVQTGTLTLQWTAPVTRADGTPLSLADIDGYRILYGDSAGNYPNRLEVPDGTAQSATITDIPVGTYYIVMTTYDVDGRESAYSSMVAKTAP